MDLKVHAPHAWKEFTPARKETPPFWPGAGLYPAARPEFQAIKEKDEYEKQKLFVAGLVCGDTGDFPVFRIFARAGIKTYGL